MVVEEEIVDSRSRLFFFPNITTFICLEVGAYCHFFEYTILYFLREELRGRLLIVSLLPIMSPTLISQRLAKHTHLPINTILLRSNLPISVPPRPMARPAHPLSSPTHRGFHNNFSPLSRLSLFAVLVSQSLHP